MEAAIEINNILEIKIKIITKSFKKRTWRNPVSSNIEVPKPTFVRDLPRVLIRILVISYNFCEFFRTHLFQRTFSWLLVKLEKRETANINQKQISDTKVKL